MRHEWYEQDWEGYVDTVSRGLPVIANKSRLEAYIGRLLPGDLFKFAPWGNRCIVVREVPVRKVGSIHVPEVAVEKLAEGWVLSVGPDVGGPGSLCPYPGERLVGCKVVFGKYAGDNIGVTTKDPLVDQEEEGLYTLIRDGDIWGTVGDPPTDSVL
jgi:co-chaperonin GroES (HSP10)